MNVLTRTTVLAVALMACDGGATPQAAPPATSQPSKSTLYPELQAYVATVLAEFDQIPADRKANLEILAEYARTRRAAGEPVLMTFICTHNSRRSHMGQLWAAVAAAHYGIDGVQTYSGGTEATAFNPRAVAALERAGFRIAPTTEPPNPRYQVRFSDAASPQECFSKKYDDPSNPQANFAAVMTCSEADEACPMVAGAALRVSLPYVDPKGSDGTPGETAAYDERAKQIATEMFYLFSKVAPG